MSFLPENYSEPKNPLFNYPDFVTHVNYLDSLKVFSKGLTLNCDYKQGVINESKILAKKLNLIRLTWENLSEEFKKIKEFPEYAIICSSWMPIKSYYLFFNLLLVIEYLIFEDEECFKIGHKKALDNFKNLLRQDKIYFDNKIFNSCVGANQILKWKIPKSENLKRRRPDQLVRAKQIIKKLYLYAKSDYKLARNIKRLSGGKLIDFNNRTTISLSDFFYWYRIKANYRDMEFMDEHVPTKEFFDFYENYYYIIGNFYNAFKKQVNIMSTEKIGRKIL